MYATTEIKTGIKSMIWLSLKFFGEKLKVFSFDEDILLPSLVRWGIHLKFNNFKQHSL